MWPPAESMSSVPIFLFFFILKKCVCAFLNSKWRAQCVTIAVGAHSHTHALSGLLFVRFFLFHFAAFFVLMQHTHGHVRNALCTVAGIKCNTRTHSHRMNKEGTLYARCKGMAMMTAERESNVRWLVPAALDSLFFYFIVFQCWFSTALHVVVCMRWCALRVGH